MFHRGTRAPRGKFASEAQPLDSLFYKTDDENNPQYRSRLVAREFRKGEKPELYSGTPPVELGRALVAKVASAQKDKLRWSETYYKKQSGNLVLNSACKFCSYKHKCWETLQTLPSRVSKSSNPPEVDYVFIGDGNG